MLHNFPQRQRGAALMVMLVILILGAAAMLLNSLNSSTQQLARAKITADALAQAKEALIAYATAVDLSSDRPGNLPCPDLNNDGMSNDGSCGNTVGSKQSRRLGRLPWKTLGLPDLRDGSGERLWYAVSNNFKKSTQIPLLNSDTIGTITVRTSDGSLLNDGSNISGAVAIIISPGEVLQRTDKPSLQDRSSTGRNVPENYLDIAYGEDNANFTDSTSNGFIQGRIKDANDKVILNDHILVITRDNIMQAIQKRVAKEVVIALNKYYCGDTNVNPITGACITAAGNRFYPRPADFTEATCRGNGDLKGLCISNSLINRGRIPATPATAWSISSILRGTNTSNWFKDNAWREVIFYAVAPACTDGTTNCNGAGYLTLNISSASAVVIATGRALAGQSHSGVAAATTISNYLEGENLVPLDDTYTSKSSVTPFNDITISIP